MPIDARKILANVNPKYYFWVCDGQIVKNMQELSNALNKMNNNVFRYHVTKDKNDFKAWIKDVLKDTVLNRQIGKCKTVKELSVVIKKRLDYLKKKRKQQLLDKKAMKETSRISLLEKLNKPVTKKTNTKKKKIIKKKNIKKSKLSVT